MTRTIAAKDVGTILDGATEFAFLDVREIVPFGTGHPLLATNLPLSEMELSVRTLVPRCDTPVVVTDGDGECAPLAAERLAKLGYTDVAVLDGGAKGWEAAGETLYPEIEVPAKGFGAFAKRNGHPDLIEAPELDRAMKAGENLIVLDARPRAEYQAGNIPGSTNAPGGDLVRWFDDLVPDPATTVVVNCMSHTRGTLGGLSLVAAGVPNRIRVLNHGTRGWLLAGFELEKDAQRFPGPPSARSVANARERAARIAERAGIRTIDGEMLDRWRKDAGRTTYLFDVRTPAEYDAGHLPGARNAPEGSLVMASGHYFATLNARIVVTDDDTVRATVNALWLAQMGCGEIAMLKDGIGGLPLETGPEASAAVEPDIGRVRVVQPAELDALRKVGPLRVVDAATSDSYVEGHLPGAIWCSRVALSGFLDREPFDGLTVFTSCDGVIARFSAGDLNPSQVGTVAMLDGGNRAWCAAGFALEPGEGTMAAPRDDHFHKASERPGDTRQNVIDYLNWEVTLLNDIERGGRVPYRNLIWR